MAWYKRALLAVCLAFVLLAAAVSPALLISYQNKHSLEKVSFENYARPEVDENTQETAPAGSEGDFRRKVLAFSESMHSSGVRISEQLGQLNEDEQAELFGATLAQLDRLRELGVAPEFEPEGYGELISLSKISIPDPADEGRWFEFLELTVDFGNCSIMALMDAETQLFFNIYVRSFFNSIDMEGTSFDGFVEYYGLDKSRVTLSPEDVDANGYTRRRRILIDDLLISFELSSTDMHFQYMFYDAVILGD